MMANVRSIFWRLYSAETGAHPAELVRAFSDFSGRTRRDPDLHRGSLEGDRPGDPQQWNRNAPAIDERGWPNDAVAIAQDVIGANEDESEGG
jgi:hypothetical protein